MSRYMILLSLIELWYLYLGPIFNRDFQTGRAPKKGELRAEGYVWGVDFSFEGGGGGDRVLRN